MLQQQQDAQNNTTNSNAGELMDDDKPIILKPQSRTKTAMLPPVLSKIVDKDPMQSLSFTEEAIIASCKSGKLYMRMKGLLPLSISTSPFSPHMKKM